MEQIFVLVCFNNFHGSIFFLKILICIVFFQKLPSVLQMAHPSLKKLIMLFYIAINLANNS